MSPVHHEAVLPDGQEPEPDGIAAVVPRVALIQQIGDQTVAKCAGVGQDNVSVDGGGEKVYDKSTKITRNTSTVWLL